MTTPEDEDHDDETVPQTPAIPARPSPREMFPAEEQEAPPDVFDPDVRRSHRQHKAQVDAYARLAKDLVELSPSKRSTLGLEPELAADLDACGRLRKGPRIREQRRIATRLRQFDARDLRDRVDALGRVDRARVEQEKALEAWRERLLDEGDTALDAFLQAHPGPDPRELRQQLRQMVRAASKDRTKGKGIAAYRKILRELRAAAAHEA